ncbi:MAG: ribosomal protein S18-alanine N-acetyltransferase [Albidovulum sp.]
MTDPATLAGIHAASFRNPRPWSADEIAAILSGTGTFLLTAPHGFLIGRAIAGEAELLTLAVAPDARRQGSGGRLLADFLAESARRGAESAFLEVAADNAAALALYRRHGFAEAGRRRGYYRDSPGEALDAIVMSRRLARVLQKT